MSDFGKTVQMPDRFRVFNVIVAAPAQWTPTHKASFARGDSKKVVKTAHLREGVLKLLRGVIRP
jgi:hypothetical protein